MSVRERRVAIAELIECVFVTRGHGPAAGRVAICRRGEGPAELPRTGCSRRGAAAVRARARARARRCGRPPGSRRAVERAARARPSSRPSSPAVRTGRRGTRFTPPGARACTSRSCCRAAPRLWARRLGVEHPRRPADQATHGRRSASARRSASTCSDKRAWPTPAEFRADGLGQLRAAITAHGGIDRWAHEFGLPPPHRLRGSRTWWTEERIEAELRRFAAGREVFPAAREFRRAGQAQLLARCAGTAA